MSKEKEPWADYIGFDLFGYEYNIKYPPQNKELGNEFDGYPTPNQQTFFYDFCVNLYGVVFYYEGNQYEAEFSKNGPILTNKTTGDVQGPFDDAVHLIEESVISGKKMITILEELTNVVLH